MDDWRILGFTNNQEVRLIMNRTNENAYSHINRCSQRLDSTTAYDCSQKSRNLRMQNVPDKVLGVTYQSGPKKWMESLNIIDWLR